MLKICAPTTRRPVTSVVRAGKGFGVSDDGGDAKKPAQIKVRTFSQISGTLRRHLSSGLRSFLCVALLPCLASFGACSLFLFIYLQMPCAHVSVCVLR